MKETDFKFNIYYFKQKFRKKCPINQLFIQIVTWMGSILGIAFEDYSIWVSLISKWKLFGDYWISYVFSCKSTQNFIFNYQRMAKCSVTKGWHQKILNSTFGCFLDLVSAVNQLKTLKLYLDVLGCYLKSGVKTCKIAIPIWEAFNFVKIN